VLNHSSGLAVLKVSDDLTSVNVLIKHSFFFRLKHNAAGYTRTGESCY
jgi:hypothetical protein